MRVFENLSTYYGAVVGQPIVEMAGTDRVLIENHLGVKLYCRQQIDVKVEYGSVVICGENMVLARMTKEQLIVTGVIHMVRLCPKEDK